MLCNNCKKNEATFYYKKTVNGKTTEYALCAECAKKLKSEGKIDSDTTSLFGGSVFDPLQNFESVANTIYGSLFSLGGGAKSTPTKKCELCGSSFAELKKNGKVGCARCYETFSEELAGTIYSIHGNASYTGKAPKCQTEKRARAEEIARLRNELSAAIQSERYEDAAVLRDRIRKLEENA